MYIYFDKNGVLKEIITERNARVGDYLRDKIHVYWDGVHSPTQGWIQYELPDGSLYPESVEEQFYQRPTTHLVGKELPNDPVRNLKYFSYNHTYEEDDVQKLGYLFYEITIPTDVLNCYTNDIKTFNQNNLVRARIRWVGTDIDAMGVIPFSVESTIGILQDNSIDQSQYNYLLQKIAEFSNNTGIPFVTLLATDTLSVFAQTNGSPIVGFYNNYPYLMSIKVITSPVLTYTFEIFDLLLRNRWQGSSTSDLNIVNMISTHNTTNTYWKPFASMIENNDYEGQQLFKNVFVKEAGTDGHSYNITMYYGDDKYVRIYSRADSDGNGILRLQDNSTDSIINLDLDVSNGKILWDGKTFNLPTNSGTLQTENDINRIYTLLSGSKTFASTGQDANDYNWLTQNPNARISYNNRYYEEAYSDTDVVLFICERQDTGTTTSTEHKTYAIQLTRETRTLNAGTTSFYDYSKSQMDALLAEKVDKDCLHITNMGDDGKYYFARLSADQIAHCQRDNSKIFIERLDGEIYGKYFIKTGAYGIGIYYTNADIDFLDKSTYWDISKPELMLDTSTGDLSLYIEGENVLSVYDKTQVYNKSEVYTKGQVDTLFNSALVYKGSKTVAQLNAMAGDADTYDSGETYNTGDFVIYQDIRYVCLADNVTGNWNSSNWEECDKIGAFYNVTTAGVLLAGNVEVFAGDNVAWTGEVWDKITMDLSAYDDKFIAAGFFEVQNYNEGTGEITFVYASNLYTMTYDSNTGVLTIEAN